MTISDLDPQVAAAKEIVKGLKDLKPVWNEILEQFGISKSDNFQGLIPLSLLLYKPSKELIAFLHNLVIIEGQVMHYLEMLGADVEGAVKTVQKAATLEPLAPLGQV